MTPQKSILNKVNSSHLIAGSIFLFMVALWFATFDLGQKYNQPIVMRLVVPTSLVLSVVAHGLLSCQPNSRIRIAHGTAFAFYLVAAVAMSIFYLSETAGASARGILEPVKNIAGLGSVIYSGLFGVGMSFSLFAVIVSRATMIQSDSGIEAVAGFVKNLVIGAAIVASSIHIYEFGRNIARLNEINAAAATFILDLGFLTTKANIEHQLRRRVKYGLFDVFDLIGWGFFAALMMAFLIIINDISVRYYSPFPASGSYLSTAITIYGISPTIVLAGISTMTILTKIFDRDVKMGGTKSIPRSPRVEEPLSLPDEMLATFRPDGKR